MNITDRNVGRDNKQIQNVFNAINNILSAPNKDPKQIRVLQKVPKQSTFSFKKNINYDLEYATKNNIPARSSYHDDLINSLNLKTQDIDENTHTLLTASVAEVNDFSGKRLIEKVKPKNQVSGIIDKNLMSHIIVPSSLASSVVPRNDIKPMNVYRKAHSGILPPIITPVTTLKEKMITIR